LILPVYVPGTVTVKVCVAEVPPPGALFVTEKFRPPAVALLATVMFAVIWVALFTVVVLRVTSSVEDCAAVLGAMPVNVGAGLLTVKD